MSSSRRIEVTVWTWIRRLASWWGTVLPWEWWWAQELLHLVLMPQQEWWEKNGLTMGVVVGTRIIASGVAATAGVVGKNGLTMGVVVGTRIIASGVAATAGVVGTGIISTGVLATTGVA